MFSGGIALLAGVLELYLFPSAKLPEIVASSTSTGLWVLLALTPLGVGRAFRVGFGISFPRIRWYRVGGVVLYTLMPMGLLVKFFPLGLVAVLFCVWWGFAPLVVLVEGDGGRTALRRSRMLSQGEFGRTALPIVLSLTLFYIGLVATLRLVPHYPPGFDLAEEGSFVRTLSEGESYDPVTRILTTPDGRGSALPPEVTYDAASRTLRLPATPPVPLGVALAWVGVPWFLAVVLDPIRWFVFVLLYVNLRVRREGWTREEMFAELIRES